MLEQRGELKLDKPLSSDFQLILKHPAEFTALADLLKSKFPLFAVVRDPLAVLAAWQTVDMPVGRGRMPMAEAFCPELAARLMEAGDPLARQVILIEWQLRTYLSLPPGRTLRYEDVVAAPDVRLAALAPGRQGPLGAMEPYDPLTRYPAVDFRALATALRPLGELIQRFYPDFERAWAQRLP